MATARVMVEITYSDEVDLAEAMSALNDGEGIKVLAIESRHTDVS